MTDKQIIIDGVDVSGCKEYISSLSHVCNLVNGKTDEFECNCYPNCYYKQLKRKEQECEKLKKEQSEIKKYLGISHKTILEQLEELTDFRDRDREELDQLKAEYDKIKNCLAEIKGIAENMNNECFYDDFECKDCDMKNGCTYFNKKQILQKISEDLNDG